MRVGKMLKFYASVRMEVKRVGQVKQGDEVIGNETLVKITKNKIAPPFKEASFQIMYGKGISRVGEILDMALDNDIVSKSGAWFSFGDIRLGQGKENVKARLENEPELLEKIEEEVRKILNKGKEEESTEEILEVKEGVLDFDEEI